MTNQDFGYCNCGESRDRRSELCAACRHEAKKARLQANYQPRPRLKRIMKLKPKFCRACCLPFQPSNGKSTRCTPCQRQHVQEGKNQNNRDLRARLKADAVKREAPPAEMPQQYRARMEARLRQKREEDEKKRAERAEAEQLEREAALTPREVEAERVRSVPAYARGLQLGIGGCVRARLLGEG